MQIFLTLQRYLSGQTPSQSCCISAWINEHYKHSNPIKLRKQSAPSPWIYCIAQTTKGAVKPSHKKEANSLLRAGQAALHTFQVKGENPALLQQLFSPAPPLLLTQGHPSWGWQHLFAWQSHSHVEQSCGVLWALPEDSWFFLLTSPLAREALTIFPNPIKWTQINSSEHRQATY